MPTENHTEIETSIKADYIEHRAQGPPRVHGNGFIQVDLGGNERLHVWGHSDIPRQDVYTGIHDHRFDFVSTVIRGRLLNVTYAAAPSAAGEWQVYRPRVREGEDTKLVPQDTYWSLLPVSIEMVSSASASRRYGMISEVIHETIPRGPAATIIRKTGVDENYEPRVFVPVGAEPDNDFDRYGFSEERLWSIIREVLCDSN